MEEVHVRIVEKEMIVQISMILDGTLHQMNRDGSEMIGCGLTRLQRKLDKKRRKNQQKQNKKQKKERSKNPAHSADMPPPPPPSPAYEPEIEVFLVDADDQPLDLENPDLIHRTGWKDGQYLMVAGERFEVVINPPHCVNLSIPASSVLMAHYEVCVQVESEFADELRYKWYRGMIGQPNDEEIHGIATGSAYVPTDEDVGAFLRVECYPLRDGRQGRICTSELLGPILPEVVPALEALRVSCVGSGPVESPLMRVVCYNILADPFATSEFCKTVLYPYVQPQHLELDYRMQLCIRELLSYQADLIMLQECDLKAFEKILHPRLSRHGFDGLYKGKSGQAAEGCATFFRRSRFDVFRNCDIDLCDCYSALPEIGGLLDQVPAVKKVMCENITTIAQITVLTPVEDSSSRLIVANTHLFFHPDAPCIRLMQGYTILMKVMEVKQQLHSEGLGVSVIVCGDLNSTSTRGAALVQLMGTGSVPSDHPTWQMLQDFRWGKRGGCFTEEIPAVLDKDSIREDAEAINNNNTTISESFTETNKELDVGVDSDEPKVIIDEEMIPRLHHDLQLFNACEGVLFTNCSSAFQDVLDYIFVDDSFEVSKLFRMPTNEMAHENVALPSVIFPSDHISLVVDIKQKQWMHT